MKNTIAIVSILLFYFVYNAEAQTIPPTSVEIKEIDANIFERVEVEASYPGGISEWIKFLQHNLRADVPVNKNAPIGKYTIIMQFVVNKEGTITDIKPLTKFGYGMEEEVTRILKKSGKWNPAIQNGKQVNAYRKQPVTFQVDNINIEVLTKIQYVLFANKGNPISIKITKIKPADLKVTINQGDIDSDSNGNFIIRNLKAGRAIMKIYKIKKENVLGTIDFEVRE